MKRKKTVLAMLAASLILCVGCVAGEESGPSAEVSETSEIAQTTSAESEDSRAEESENGVSEETSGEESKEMNDALNERVPLPERVRVQSNLDFDNRGQKMGDNDGPAYCVYSKMGYNKASMDVLISQIRVNNIRKSDGRFVNMYMFLGCDVYSAPDGWWVNCFDSGFCYSGSDPAWHLFYNIYKPAVDGQYGWYESKVRLDPTHDYRLTLDTSFENERAKLTVYDLTDGRDVDEVTFGVKDLRSDGTTTSYLMDFAIDFPDNTKLGPDGKPSDNWSDIVLYNTDEDLFLQNVNVENVVIRKNGKVLDWDAGVTDHRAMWPDCSNKEIDYACTYLVCDEDDYDVCFRVDLDMNR